MSGLIAKTTSPAPWLSLGQLTNYRVLFMSNTINQSIVHAICTSPAILRVITDVVCQNDWGHKEIVRVVKQHLDVDVSKLIGDPKCAIEAYFNQPIQFELRCYKTESEYEGSNGEWLDGGLTLEDTVGIIDENKLFEQYAVIIFRPHCDEFEETVKRADWEAFKQEHLPKERHVAAKAMICDAINALVQKTEALSKMKGQLTPDIAGDKFGQRLTGYNNSIARCEGELTELQYSLEMLN